MADVFLSYARTNLNAAKRVAATLRAAGYSVWFDEKLPAHRAYSDVIEEQLDAAKAVVVLWSKEAVASQWVRSEANRARESGRLVQLRIDEVRLPMPFDQIQCADLRDWSGKRQAAAWRTVEESVAALAGDERSAPTASTSTSSSVNRRNVLVAGGAAAALAAGGLVTWRPREPETSPEAQLLLQKGLDALQQNDALDTELASGAGAQAVALLTKATEADPDSAAAWGGLAMAYAVRKKAAPLADRAGYAERSRSAAERGLALDERNHRASAALRMLDPVYRNWLAAERAARESLKLHPTFPIHIFLMSDVLGSVGRWREAAELSLRADRTAFLIPGADRKVVVNLWAAGRLQEADEMLRQAIERWPEHPQVWRTQLAYLMYSGQPSDALELLNRADRPAAIPAGLVAAAQATGQALAGRADKSAAVQANLAYLRDSPTSALQVAQACTAVGDSDTALSLLRGYYFGEGQWAALGPPGGDQDRYTSPLFMPPMRALWKDARFGDLLRRVGLEDYWRRSGTRPDYRA